MKPVIAGRSVKVTRKVTSASVHAPSGLPRKSKCQTSRQPVIRSLPQVHGWPRTLPGSAACDYSSSPAAVMPRSRSLRSEEHTSELQSPCNLVCRLLLEKKKKTHEQILYDVCLLSIT